MRSHTRTAAAALVAALAVAVPAGSAVAEPDDQRPAPGANGKGSAGEPLDILLTNDDGYQAPTLAALDKALTEAGHRVTVVAPCDEQSGTGTKMFAKYAQGPPTEENTIEATRREPGTWSVCGSPGDSVFFGVQRVFDSEPPDLVVSGANPGQNTGAVANHSGTVGATVAAGELGIPAIAVSVEIDLTSDPPQLGPVPDAAAYAVRLIERLQGTSRRGELLPEHTALNVNYPVAEETRGTKVTRTGRKAFVRARYEPTDLCENCYVAQPEVDTGRDPVRGSDNNALADDYVSVTPLDGDWTAPRRVRTVLRNRLSGLS